MNKGPLFFKLPSLNKGHLKSFALSHFLHQDPIIVLQLFFSIKPLAFCILPSNTLLGYSESQTSLPAGDCSYAKMRPEAVVPILITLVAFILSLLCIFAGDKPGYLEHANLLTVNASMLGHTAINTSDSSSSFISSIENSVKSDINDIVSDIARAINLHDFYSAHVLDYCEGFYTPSPVANLTSSPSKNVTGCSTSRAMFHFDPAQIIQNELKPGLNLTDLKWPVAIQDAIKAIELASKVMFVVYCIGAAAVGLAWIGAMLSFFASGRLSAVVNFMLSSVSLPL